MIEMNGGACEEHSDHRIDATVRLDVRKVFDKYGQNLSKTSAALNVARNAVRKYL